MDHNERLRRSLALFCALLLIFSTLLLINGCAYQFPMPDEWTDEQIAGPEIDESIGAMEALGLAAEAAKAGNTDLEDAYMMHFYALMPELVPEGPSTDALTRWELERLWYERTFGPDFYHRSPNRD